MLPWAFLLLAVSYHSILLFVNDYLSFFNKSFAGVKPCGSCCREMTAERSLETVGIRRKFYLGHAAGQVQRMLWAECLNQGKQQGKTPRGKKKKPLKPFGFKGFVLVDDTGLEPVTPCTSTASGNFFGSFVTLFSCFYSFLVAIQCS
jgi:hypothetical protein